MNVNTVLININLAKQKNQDIGSIIVDRIKEPINIQLYFT
jgi:hypothetical protein